MTVADARKAVEEISALAYDDETAHALEDKLHHAVLGHIAKTAPEPWRSIAAEALKTQEIAFSRWCA